MTGPGCRRPRQLTGATGDGQRANAGRSSSLVWHRLATSPAQTSQSKLTQAGVTPDVLLSV